MKRVRGDYCPIRKLYFWKLWNGKEKWVTHEELQMRRLHAAQQMALHRSRNPEEYREKVRIRYSKKKEAAREYQRAWRQRNLVRRREQQREYNKQKRREDPIFLLKGRIRGRTRKVFLKMGIPKRGATGGMLGCSWSQLKEHIEGQFQDGMTWDNRGLWHIDHIVPLSSAKDAESLYRLANFSNLQPLWASDNMSKGAKVDVDIFDFAE